ncbi:MAG: shikimate 5-dehydrogenase [Planctomycetota bacterium]
MFVVTLPKNRAHDAATFSRHAQKAGANLLEIRGDLTPDLPKFESSLPLLLSPRGLSLDRLPDDAPAFIDLEWNEQQDIPSEATMLIRSLHDYEKTPRFEELLPLVASMFASKPHVTCLKVATRIRRAADLLTLKRIYEAFAPIMPICVLGMGELAWPNRILSPWVNPLSYVALDESERSAPGQLLLRDSVSLFHAHSPALFAVLGGKGLKSLSPKIHNNLFKNHHVDGYYGSWPTDHLVEDFESLAEFGLVGFSVTSPHKITMRSKMDRIDASATALPSVNTCVKEGEEWVGYQTDAEGIVNGYPEFEGIKSVAIVGSGGVVASVVDACRQLGGRRIKIFARNAGARLQLKELLQLEDGELSQLKEERWDLLIWTLPVDSADLELPEPNPGGFALDLRYGRSTAFLERAAQLGYCVSDGLRMLLNQALAQYELFCGKKATDHDRRFLSELMKSHVQ